ncbi:uncharacterized protein LOC143600814 [Bidens hawaiensis]|uniref:uncharacterized protein LOC143600814 n=1 Tax=Bidens hawaiensis TaxID=980011 RepID=UPI004049907F
MGHLSFNYPKRQGEPEEVLEEAAPRMNGNRETLECLCSTTRKLQTYRTPSPKELNMCQRRWMETLNDYDYEIIYHERKANVVPDALSRKEHEKPKRVRALRLEHQVDLIKQIKKAQEQEIKENQISEEKHNGTIDSLTKGDDGILQLGNIIWVPVIGELREKIMNEAHKSKCMMHPGSDKTH